MQRGDELTLKLESAAFEGKNISHCDGLVVFVRGGVPGDTARVRLTKIKKQFLEADCVSVEEPSPLRVVARCRHFGICGGCTWQEMAYQGQVEFKRQHVVDALERIGGLTGIDVQPTLGSAQTYYYRNKMEFSFGDKWLTRDELEDERVRNDGNRREPSWALGLHIPQRFDKVLDVKECWLQSETSTLIVNRVRDFALQRGLDVYSTRAHTGFLRNLVIRESKRTGERMVNIVTREEQPGVMAEFRDMILQVAPDTTTIVNNITDRKSQVATGERETVLHGPGYITDMIGRRRYRISANSFFQTNTEQAECLYDVAKDMAGLTGKELVYDLYCGTGTIALHIAEGAREVVGIEAIPQAIADARSNATLNNVANCVFILGDLKDMMTKDTEWRRHHPGPDVVIVDPPRSGMHEAVVRQLLDLGPLRIVYVSCNPSTQARDLSILAASGRYVVRTVQPVDMFPHTFHVENVALVERKLA